MVCNLVFGSLHREMAWFRGWFHLVPCGAKIWCYLANIGIWLGSWVGSNWFHLVPTFCDVPKWSENGLVPGLVPLGSDPFWCPVKIKQSLGSGVGSIWLHVAPSLLANIWIWFGSWVNSTWFRFVQCPEKIRKWFGSGARQGTQGIVASCTNLDS